MNYIKLLLARYSLILKYTGIIVIIIGGFLLSPLLYLLFNPEELIYAKYFLLPSGFTLLTGFIFYFYFGKGNTEISLTLKEGGVIVLFSWITAILSSTIPFIWGMDMSFTGSVFESVSGWTTTGLSVMDVTQTPDIFLLWRSIMQLAGGAGLAVIAISSILPMQGLGLYRAEGRSDQLLPHVRRSTNMIIRIYAGYTLAGVILYYISGMDIFNAVNHSFAALSTGGFSTVPTSIGHWNNLKIELVTIILMFLGTINFATHYALIKGEVSKFLKNAEIKLMGLLIGFSLPLMIYVSLIGLYGNFQESFRAGIFQIITALSTTGFSTIDFNTWPIFSNFIIILLMLIGGGTGSTAGGIKQYRIYIIFKSIYWEIRQQFFPDNQVKENFIWRGEEKWYIKSKEIRNIANYIFLYLFTYITGVGIFLMKGFPLKESLFEFGSALGTVGLSVGITSAEVDPIILWTETFGMLLGRLEILIIIFSFIKLFKDVKVIAAKRK